MKRIAIIGAGQSGLQLGLGLLEAGYQVTLYSDRSAEEIQNGRVMSSQCMFDSALETERDLGLNYWEQQCPKVEGIGFAVPDFVGGKVMDWAARLDNFAQSVDQRLKIPRWMGEFQKRGGDLQGKVADIDDLEGCARSHDLVIVASGKGTIGQLFQRDASRSPFSEAQRVLALTYVKGMRPREPYPAVCFNLVPNVGEYFVFPALTTTGPCEIMVFEGIPGGAMDCWTDVKSPAEHLARSKRILESFMPWEAERCREIELTDDNGILVGRVVPTVRHPIGILPSGRKVLAPAAARTSISSVSMIRSRGRVRTMRPAPLRFIWKALLKKAMSLPMRNGCSKPSTVTGQAMHVGSWSGPICCSSRPCMLLSYWIAPAKSQT